MLGGAEEARREARGGAAVVEDVGELGVVYACDPTTHGISMCISFSVTPVRFKHIRFGYDLESTIALVDVSTAGSPEHPDIAHTREPRTLSLTPLPQNTTNVKNCSIVPTREF